MDTYASQAEFLADKAQLRAMVVALDAAQSQLRLDACRTWTIQGKRGYVATWGDGKQWFIYCSPGSARKWGNIRRALSPLGRCTQDGDDEGIIRIDQLPNPEQAAAIRKAIGLTKRPAVDIDVITRNLSEARRLATSRPPARMDDGAGRELARSNCFELQNRIDTR
jgi:hypothetical protein